MPDLKNRSVLVTGAAGFIGSNLVRRLISTGNRVTALVRPDGDYWRLTDIQNQIQILECDLLNLEQVQFSINQSQPDLIYHAAFPGGHTTSTEGKAQMLATGLLGTHFLLESSANLNLCPFIYIGSSTCYGSLNRPHRESDPLDPVVVRGVGKAAGSLLCQQHAHENKRSVCEMRLFTVYGPWEQPARLVPTACRCALTGNSLQTTPPGYMHDWIYIDDVIDACIMAGEKDWNGGEVFNLGTGEQHSNEEIIEILEQMHGAPIAKIPGVYAPRLLDTQYWIADPAHSREKLGWEAVRPLREGLRETYTFWKEHLNFLSV